MQLRPVDLRRLVDEVLQQIEPEISARGAQVVVGTLPPVVSHRATLAQVISNLIDNVTKFVAPGMAPCESAPRDEGAPYASGSRTTVSGIPSEHQERVFNMFERLHSADDYAGTGIGLAIVRKAVERLGGRLGLESEVGKGTRFWIELPSA